MPAAARPARAPHQSVHCPGEAAVPAARRPASPPVGAPTTVCNGAPVTSPSNPSSHHGIARKSLLCRCHGPPHVANVTLWSHAVVVRLLSPSPTSTSPAAPPRPAHHREATLLHLPPENNVIHDQFIPGSVTNKRAFTEAHETLVLALFSRGQNMPCECRYYLRSVEPSVTLKTITTPPR